MYFFLILYFISAWMIYTQRSSYPKYVFLSFMMNKYIFWYMMRNSSKKITLHTMTVWYQEIMMCCTCLLLPKLPNSIICILCVLFISRCNIVYQCLWYYYCISHLYLNNLICKVCIIVVLYKHIYMLMYCLKFMSKNKLVSIIT